MLPPEVIARAQRELPDFDGKGMSVMEISHRSDAFLSILHTTEQRLRELMGIPSNYHVLFLQGGAWMQFAMVPMNLMKKGLALYADTGAWASKAAEEAAKFGQAKVVASSKSSHYTHIPAFSPDWIDPQADYLHITTNNTIYGTTWPYTPATGALPLVADMSSNILSQPYRVEDFGLIYAGAQKNIGPSGLTIVIIREDLLSETPASVPTMMAYRTYAENESMFNTPPTFGIYLAGLVFEWLQAKGGVEAQYQENLAKAACLYDFLDQSEAFQAVVKAREDRSLMNVVFHLSDPGREKAFVAATEAVNMYFLKGHRSVGGFRASLYNAMPLAGVQALVELMRRFEAGR